MIQLNYRDSKPIYEQIKDGIRRLVVTSSFQTGEQIPSVRELAASLAINPNTIQKAYRDLEDEGYLYTIAGKGTFVADCTNAKEKKRDILWEKFDEAVKELFCLSIDKAEITARVERLVKGEDGGDTGKKCQ